MSITSFQQPTIEATKIQKSQKITYSVQTKTFRNKCKTSKQK